MRRVDAAAIRGGIPSAELMENAASALAADFRRAWPRARAVTVLCGPGNNGGDGLAAARLLAGAGLAVRVFTLRDPEAYRGDAATNAARARAVGLTLESLATPRAAARLAEALAECDAIVDALFGTGLARPLLGLAARTVSAVNGSRRPVLSADLPSGLSSDTGALIGPAVAAARTVAFGAPKVCHVAFPARGRCGEVVVADIGISRETLCRTGSRLFLAEAADVRRLCPPRPREGHKGTFGRVAIVAGSRGKTGAAILAARGALRAGAGLVTVFCAESLEPAIVTALPEAMTMGLPEERGAIAERAAGPALEALRAFDAAVVGPGLSTAPGTVRFLRRLLRARLPLVADADALNAFAGDPSAFAGVSRVITPHPGEAARLLGTTTREIESDRLAAARRLARTSRATVLLKGAASLVARPRGEVSVNPTGTPLMAVAGSGDVLSGAIGAFLARGLAPGDAAVAAAWLHGASGERLAAILGDAGLLASELADGIPAARRVLLAGPRRRRESRG
jgi:ADP-dependent NAD(P)H-hydrate dehydratase / NAD(P)H-hydrate epimerase